MERNLVEERDPIYCDLEIDQPDEMSSNSFYDSALIDDDDSSGSQLCYMLYVIDGVDFSQFYENPSPTKSPALVEESCFETLPFHLTVQTEQMSHPLCNAFDADLAQNHSGSSLLFLNSLGHILSDQSVDGRSASGDYYRSQEWHQLFPSLLGSLDRFDKFSTSNCHIPTFLSSALLDGSSTFSTPQSLNTSECFPSMDPTPTSTADPPVSPKPQNSEPPSPDPLCEMDITPFLCMPQIRASQMLHVRASTLTKKWKDATGNRK